MSLEQTNVKPQYEDFEPSLDWLQDEEAHTLCVTLPGFRKEQLKVQITSSRILKLSGERKNGENKQRRFHKELSIPNDADTGGIRAKFENGVLYIRLTKVKTTTTKTPKPDEAPNAQVDQQQKPRDQKTEPQTPTPTPTHEPPQDEQKYDEKKQMKEKGKVEEKDAKKDAKNERAEATISRSPTGELVSRQTQEYKSAVYGMVEEIKKQKKLANLVLVVLFVLAFVLYVNNAIKSYFGGSKTKEL